jgi:hypothetical protein
MTQEHRRILEKEEIELKYIEAEGGEGRKSSAVL